MPKGWAESRDKRFMSDMYREIEQDVAKRDDPATKAMTCKCGHPISNHYPGTQAMPCSKCSCVWCTAPRAEDIRRKRAQLGVKDITPHPDFRKGGRR
jgi:hypothetical protein